MIEQQVVVGQRAGVHADLRQVLRIGQEALPQGLRVGQLTGGQQALQVLAQGGLAALIVSQRQSPTMRRQASDSSSAASSARKARR